MENEEELTDLLKEKLDLSSMTFIEDRNGLISEGKVYQTVGVNGIFVKVNRKQGARLMFEGEVASLKALKNADQVRVPDPIKIVDIPTGGAALAMEFIDLTEISSQHEVLGHKLARLHLHNDILRRRSLAKERTIGDYERSPRGVDKFGFDVTTCVGFIPQPVTWSEDWTIYFSNLLEYRIRLIELEASSVVDKEIARQVRELWTDILRFLPGLFRDLDIKPSLLHGDLHRYNAGETTLDGPVIFDPAAFYGHSECDLAVGLAYPGFSNKFYEEYFRQIPKTPGFDERLDLYKLNQIFNYWNNFGPKQSQRAIDLMRKIIAAHSG